MFKNNAELATGVEVSTPGYSRFRRIFHATVALAENIITLGNAQLIRRARVFGQAKPFFFHSTPAKQAKPWALNAGRERYLLQVPHFLVGTLQPQ